ncbi:CoA pyrophosphatase, partial [Frankia sp. Cpl3]|nr:CoA pyrophosphatase [Frankia sp. Cpl3]
VQAHQRGLLGEKQYRRNAVLLPLVKAEGDPPALLFTKRASTLRRQSGEICFPGGHWEETDESDWATAVRETNEELHIPTQMIEYQGALDVVVMN